MAKLHKVLYVTVLLLVCCRKPYNPPAITAPNSYLVVEGIINSGNDSTIIKISKTVQLNGKTTINPLLGANVTVESDQNNSYPLYDVNGNGNYVSAALNLPAAQKYRLKIQTANGQYVSDMMAVKPTPPIDSVNYILNNGVLSLYVNTHDPANSTHYYFWSYDETWIFHSRYESDYIVDPASNTIVPRNGNQQIYYCFGNDISSNILLGNTSKLKSDLVYESPLTQIPITSEKLEQKYSILVRQYALTQDAYNFYQNLKTNTEQLGSIFDAQPSQINGNIHNVTNPNEPVIGYISVTNVQSVRIFIPNSVLPQYTLPVYPYDCEEDTALFSNKEHYNDVQNTLINPPLTALPTGQLSASGGGVIGYLYSTPQCVDCTLRGTTQTPPFWK